MNGLGMLADPELAIHGMMFFCSAAAQPEGKAAPSSLANNQSKYENIIQKLAKQFASDPEAGQVAT